jgi:hypothetical protein
LYNSYLQVEICFVKTKGLDNKYRKKFSFFSDPADHKAILTLPPTKSENYAFLEVNDCGLKYSQKKQDHFWPC